MPSGHSTRRCGCAPPIPWRATTPARRGSTPGPRAPGTCSSRPLARRAPSSPSALYNLGNARLAGGDAQAALDAYKEALRRKSDFADAKYNLELALRQLEQQQKQQQQQQEQQQQQQKQQPSQSQQQQQQQQPQQQPQQQASAPQEPEKSKQDGRPLPQFQDQADMSREQAASILQAVEALERDARRKQAAQAARTRAGVEEDW